MCGHNALCEVNLKAVEKNCYANDTVIRTRKKDRQMANSISWWKKLKQKG